MIEHLTDEDHDIFLGECKRVLKHKGLFETVIADLDHFVMNAQRLGMSTKYIESESQRIINGEGDFHGMRHLSRVSIPSTVALYEKHGFEVVLIDKIVRFWRDTVIIGRKP